jgi:hypothetical protein
MRRTKVFESVFCHMLNDNQRIIELAESLCLRVEPPTPGQPTVREKRCLN